MKTSLTAMMAGLLLSGCCGFVAAAPDGFAAFEGSGDFKAVSPDGISYRVRCEDNDPVADLEFWSEALKKRMQDAGYAFQSDGAVKAGGVDGYLLEMAAPAGRDDYSYLMAVFVREGQLVLVESAGEVARFVERRDAVVAAIEKLQL